MAAHREVILYCGATDWDMTIMYRSDPGREVADVLAHVPLMTFAMHPERLGFQIPARTLSVMLAERGAEIVARAARAA